MAAVGVVVQDADPARITLQYQLGELDLRTAPVADQTTTVVALEGAQLRRELWRLGRRLSFHA